MSLTRNGYFRRFPHPAREREAATAGARSAAEARAHAAAAARDRVLAAGSEPREAIVGRIEPTPAPRGIVWPKDIPVNEDSRW